MRHSFRCRRRFSDWYFRFRVFLTYDFATRELLVGRAVRRGRAVRGLWLGDGHPLVGMAKGGLDFSITCAENISEKEDSRGAGDIYVFFPAAGNAHDFDSFLHGVAAFLRACGMTRKPGMSSSGFISISHLSQVLPS